MRVLLEYRLPRAVLGRPCVAAEKAVQTPCWTLRTYGFCDHIVSTTLRLPCSVGMQKCCCVVISCNASKENTKVDHLVPLGSKLWPVGLLVLDKRKCVYLHERQFVMDAYKSNLEMIQSIWFVEKISLKSNAMSTVHLLLYADYPSNVRALAASTQLNQL